MRGNLPAVPFEIEELAGQFNSSHAHIRRLVKRLWRQGHISEETWKIPIEGAKGGVTRKKVYLCDPPSNDQVLQTHTEQGSEALDHPVLVTGDPFSGASMPLKVGDGVEILTGYFAGRQVEVIGFLREKPGWVEVKGKTWAITQQYQQSDLRLIRRAQR
jgi:hypothetical protein